MNLIRNDDYFVNVMARMMATAMAAISIMISTQHSIFLDRFWCCFAAARWVTPVSTCARELLI
jgi:hypothetical protein